MVMVADREESAELDGPASLGGRGDRSDPIAGLRAAVDAVLAADPARLGDEELGRNLIRFRRQMDRLDAGFSEWALAANRRGCGREDGAVSIPAWIAWKGAMPRHEVDLALRHAEVCELLPDAGRAWREGHAPSAAVELIARARVKGHDEALVACAPEMLGDAMRGDLKTLAFRTRNFAEYARADGTAPAVEDGITLVTVGDRWVLRGELTPTAGQSVMDAVDAFIRPPAPEDETTPAMRRADALVRICEVATAKGVDTAGSRPNVSYVIQAPAVDVPLPMTLGTFAGVISPGERDRILCDATITPVVVGESGVPLSVGRATSVWPVPMNRTIHTLDGGCQWPGCEIPGNWCDIHHVEHWHHGGHTATHNGCLLCRRHHRFLHAHPQWTVSFEHRMLRVFRPDGTEVFREPWPGRAG